ncbi:hypothetical protein [Edaphobacter bradus]|uniref:hypothetical protein n=1 Tax=Edaphobacter bradus TaxID=2259016 RepID=UPI0021DF4D13|nr:hypothetical protein [Edaphobacter bradus]
MNRRNLFAVTTIAASLIVSPAVYAATSIHSPVSAMFGKTKIITLTLVNDSGASMQVKAGEDVITLETGKPVTVKLPPGTRVVATTATPVHQAGSLIAEVSNALNGAVLHIK